MKIRIKENSVRFRLTKSEVATFCKEGFFALQTDFNEKVFNYAVKAVKGIENLSVSYEGDSIQMLVPDAVRKDWADSNRIGFENTIETKNGKSIYLLLEKDFVCLDETTEDQSDNYPNPKTEMLSNYKGKDYV